MDLRPCSPVAAESSGTVIPAWLQGVSVVFGHLLSYKEARLCEEKRASHQQEPQSDCGVQCYLGGHVVGTGGAIEDAEL